MTTATRLRLLALVEASTLIGMLALLVWRVALDGPDLSSMAGAVHGIAFLAYVVAVIHAREELGWPVRRTLVLLGAAVIPAGGYVVAHRIESDPSSTSPLS